MNLARELKKLLNMKVTVIPVTAGILGTVPKDLEELVIRGRIETILTTAQLKLAKGLFFFSESSEKTIS